MLALFSVLENFIKLGSSMQGHETVLQTLLYLAVDAGCAPTSAHLKTEMVGFWCVGFPKDFHSLGDPIQTDWLADMLRGHWFA